MSTKTKQAAVIDAGKGRQLTVLGHGFDVLISSAETNGDSYVFEVITPPGFSVPPHTHQREDEYGYVAEGLYEFYLGGRTIQAQAGAALHLPRYVSHGFRNIGSTTGKTIWVSTPGSNVEPFFDELAALPADGPPDMEKLLGIFTKYGMEVAPPPAA